MSAQFLPGAGMYASTASVSRPAMQSRFKYFNPSDPSATIAIAGADTNPFVVFANLPVLADKKEAMAASKEEEKTTAQAAEAAKLAADEAWIKALAAQREAKRAEAKADQTSSPEDIKDATNLAVKAMQEKANSEKAMDEALKTREARARAQTSKLSLAYQSVMQGDARYFEEACKTDQEILKRLESSLLTAQAFPPTLIASPLQVGLPMMGYAR